MRYFTVLPLLPSRVRVGILALETTAGIDASAIFVAGSQTEISRRSFRRRRLLNLLKQTPKHINIFPTVRPEKDRYHRQKIISVSS